MTTQRSRRTQGSKWISRRERLAIYLRDGMGCVYCGQGIEDGVTLSLDHVRCYSHGGRDDHTNLVTACRQCNSVRGTRSVKTFAADVARYLAVDATEIERHVGRCLRRSMRRPRSRAAELIRRRGSYSQALANAQNSIGA